MSDQTASVYVLGMNPLADAWRELCATMTAERDAARAEVDRLRSEVLVAWAEERAAVEAADRLTNERDAARAEVERLRSEVTNLRGETIAACAEERAAVEAAERDAARAEVDRLRSQVLVAWAEERAAVEAADRLTNERDAARSEVDRLRSEVTNLRGESIAARAEERAAVEAADRLTVERDTARAERDKLQALFDEAGDGQYNVLALIEHYEQRTHEAEYHLDDLESTICELLPCGYDDGATAQECILYAAEELEQLRKKVASAQAVQAAVLTSAGAEAALRQERDEARAELEKLHRLVPTGQYTRSW